MSRLCKTYSSALEFRRSTDANRCGLRLSGTAVLGRRGHGAIHRVHSVMCVGVELFCCVGATEFETERASAETVWATPGCGARIDRNSREPEPGHRHGSLSQHH